MTQQAMTIALIGAIIAAIASASGLTDARTLDSRHIVQDGESFQNVPYTPPLPYLYEPSAAGAVTDKGINLDQADNESDEDDDEDMRAAFGSPQIAAGNNNQAVVVGDPALDQTLQPLPSASVDLKTSASHHHHGHGAKGWLDMGAWTGKKGAFGWYDKHPVGKGK